MKTLKYAAALLSVIIMVAGCSTDSSQGSHTSTGATGQSYESATGAGSGANGSIGPNNPFGLGSRE